MSMHDMNPVDPIAFQVAGMTCQGCADSLTGALERIAGPGSVSVDFATGRAEVANLDPGREAELRQAVADAGFELVVNDHGDG